jgi:hypothetical protein
VDLTRRVFAYASVRGAVATTLIWVLFKNATIIITIIYWRPLYFIVRIVRYDIVGHLTESNSFSDIGHAHSVHCQCDWSGS